MKKEPVKFYILGDIERPDEEPNMSRMEAERIIHPYKSYRFDFTGKNKEELNELNNSICVAHLDSRIFQRAGRDVEWVFDDCSLFQSVNGKFFTVKTHCAPFSGGEELGYEMDKDYFNSHNVEQFFELNDGKLNLSEEDIKKLFAKREITFYAERWLTFDYTILFDYLNYGHKKEEIFKKVDEFKEKFSASPDKNKLYAYIDNEAKKAVEAEESNSWPKDEYDIISYNPFIAEYGMKR